MIEALAAVSDPNSRIPTHLAAKIGDDLEAFSAMVTQVDSLAHAKPSRGYIPWVVYTTRLAIVFISVLLLASPTFPVWFKFAVLLWAGLLVKIWTWNVIKQEFLLQHGSEIVSISVCMTILCGAKIIITREGESAHLINLGNLGYGSRYMEFDFELEGVAREFTLIHLANTRYFLMSERNSSTIHIPVVANRFCF